MSQDVASVAPDGDTRQSTKSAAATAPDDAAHADNTMQLANDHAIKSEHVALSDLFADDEQNVKPSSTALNGENEDDDKLRVKVEDKDLLPDQVEQKLEDDSDPEDLKPRTRMRHPRAAHGHERTASTSQKPTKDEYADGENEDSDSYRPAVDIIKRGRKKQRSPSMPVQLIGHLPDEERQARATFVELKDCTYAAKNMGAPPYLEEETSRCDCSYDPDDDMAEQACGPESQCINRMMMIECTKGVCKVGRHCQNQRFQKYQYANIDVVRTEKKGYGVRAAEDMTENTFIYEYVGEVIGPTSFAKRMKDYADEGIRHFYFMALEKDVFIDATKKGGLGRFLNHSCNPNCYVSKWTVGNKQRMGIFAKRDIQRDEELTFNYNVDRYGHDAQECFCGEPNCVGYIGGKTQTDLGGMDDLYLEALGIIDEVEALGLKGSKKRKGRKLDEDFNPVMKPIEMQEVAVVASAVRQALQNRRILVKLLTRYEMTEDVEVHRQLLRLYGFNCMNHILLEYPDDVEMLALDLQILNKWPLKARNKVVSSKIEEPVRKCAEMDDGRVSSLAKDLLEKWSKLEMAYVIPKSALVSNGGAGGESAGGESGNNGDRKRPAQDFSLEQLAKRARLTNGDDDAEDARRESKPVFVKPEATVIRSVEPQSKADDGPLPDGWKAFFDNDTNRHYYHHAETGRTTWERPKSTTTAADAPAVKAVHATTVPVQDVNDIVARIQKEAEAKAAAEEEARRLASEAEEAARQAKLELKARRTERSKEKKVMGLFSSLVVGVMSKYKAHLDPDQFKKRARELTDLLVAKEKKHPSYESESYERLSNEKQAKVKHFAKDWTKKLIERQRQKGAGPSSSSGGGARSRSASTATSASTSSKLPALSTGASSVGPNGGLATPSPATPSSRSLSILANGTPQQADKEDEALIASMIADVGNDDDEDEDEEDMDVGDEHPKAGVGAQEETA